MLRLAVLVSGGGSNLQAVLEAIDSGQLKETVVEMVLSSSPNAFALERAAGRDIPVRIIDAERYPDPKERDDRLLEALDALDPDLVVLAGYVKILPPRLVRRFPERIINIHPSLIPRFCGPGFYGIRVHRAVLEAGEEVSGATVHFVDEGVDTGPILLQEEVPILPGDTPETLAARVLEAEHRILPEAIRRLGAAMGKTNK